MGVSFKLSKTGRRFSPKPPPIPPDAGEDDAPQNPKVTSRSTDRNHEDNKTQVGTEASGGSASFFSTDENPISAGDEVSFTLNLFPDGYSIGKPLESDALQHASKFLRPYNRTSESLFSAIECGRLPGDLLDDLPCKYIEGSLICEVRDYRKYASNRGPNLPDVVDLPVVTKVQLKISLENIVKDIPPICSSWTYGDLMEVESRILKTLQPQLCLDPTPKLDRLSNSPVPEKLHMTLSSLQKKRLRHVPETSVTSSNKIHGKKVCIDRVPERSDSGIIQGNLLPQHVHENLSAQCAGAGNTPPLRPKGYIADASFSTLPMMSPRYQMLVGNARGMQDRGASPGGQDMMISYLDNNSSISLHGKRETQDGQSSPRSSFNKRPRLAHGPDGNQQQQMENFHTSDLNLKNTLLQQQAISRGIQFGNAIMQKFPQHTLEGVQNPEVAAASLPLGMGHRAKEEQLDTQMEATEVNRSKSDIQTAETEKDRMDPQQPQLQQRLPHHPFLRPGFSQASWSNVNQQIDTNLKKEEQIQKRKSVQSPRVSGGTLAQSPLSSKSGEFSSGSVGPQYGAAAATPVPGLLPKERAGITSVPPVGATGSLTSSANDSTLRQNQAQAAAKRRQNSLPKTPIISGVGSPASVSNIGVALNASSPSVGTPPLVDQTMLERFLKIDTIMTRYQIGHKKNKVDYPAMKPGAFLTEHLSVCLHNVSNDVNFKDDSCTRSLSKSLVGGSTNICKTRVLKFLQLERNLQGTVVSRPQTKMIMSEKSSDGTIAMHYGDLEEGDILASEEHLPTLPNTHLADLLAHQLCSLMTREGFHVEGDQVQPKLTRMNFAPSSQPNAPGTPQNNSGADIPRCPEGVSGQSSSEVLPTSNSGNVSLSSSVNIPPHARMLPPGSSHASQIASGVSVPGRSQQLDSQSLLQQQTQQLQQQHNQNPMVQHLAQFPRSTTMPGTNPLLHLNASQNTSIQLGNHMANKPPPPHLQILQQQQPQQAQQQQQQQRQSMLQRQMVIGAAMGMGNMGGNLAGLSSISNTINMAGAKGMGGPGMSASMGQMPNIGQASHIGNQRLMQPANLPRFQGARQSQAVLGGTQSGMGGVSGPRPMLPGPAGLQMLASNRANMQRAAMGALGPSKLTVMNQYMNQQQQQPMQLQHQQQQMQLQQQQQQLQQQPQQQLQLQQQQMQQQQQQQQQQQLHQLETTSPLQAVMSPPQISSPSNMAIPQLSSQSQQQQQQSSPQQMSQRTPVSPQQISSGTMHGMSAGNPEACPASPQLSSQTLGSVGTINNSPMELQGVNKSNLSSA